MKGIIGKFFFPFGITVAVAVLVSLFVSFTLDPMLSSIWKDPPGSRLIKLWGIGHLMRATDRLLEAMHAVYERLIHWVFSDRRYLRVLRPRGIVLLVGVGSFGGALLLARLVGTEFIPDADNSFISMTVTMPVGTSLARGSEKMQQVEALVRAIPEVRMQTTMSLARSSPRAACSIGCLKRSENAATTPRCACESNTASSVWPVRASVSTERRRWLSTAPSFDVTDARM